MDSSSKGGRKRTLILVIIILTLLILLTVAITLAVIFGLKNDESQCIPYAFQSSRQTDSAGSYRLEKLVSPERYELTLEPHIYHNQTIEPFYFTGSVRITITVQKDTNYFSIHAGENIVFNVTDVEVIHLRNDRKSNDVQVTRMEYKSERKWWTITLAKVLKKGDSFYLDFKKFRSNFPPDGMNRGFYICNYEVPSTSNDVHPMTLLNSPRSYFASSQLQPADARLVFPCFDEPEYKATFKTKIIRRHEFHALTNMDLIGSRNLGDGRFEDEFAESMLMSTYIQAFVVSQLASRSHQQGPLKFSVYASPQLIGQAQFSLDIGPGILKAYEDYFQIPFPIKKLDMVAVPQFTHGAMENWGLVIYREETMLFNPREHKFDRAAKVAKVVAHELAHQWFGNLVTMAWWEELWLNEGMTSFFEELGMKKRLPGWYEGEKPTTESANDDFNILASPLFQPIHHNMSISDNFNDISYNKGSLITRMIEGILGESVFREGLQNYLQENKYKNTRDKDLWKALETAARRNGNSINLGERMKSWVNESGMPVLTIKKTGPNQFYLHQERLLAIDNQEFTSKYYTHNSPVWNIPLTYILPNELALDTYNRITWFNKRSDEIYLQIPANTPAVFNVQRRGYYIVKYDKELNDMISDQLIRNHTAIPIENREMLMADTYRLAIYNQTSIKRLLDLMRYLKEEKSANVWSRVTETIYRLIRILYNQEKSKALILLFEYLNELIAPHVENITWDWVDESKDFRKRKLDYSIGTIATFTDHPRFLDLVAQQYQRIKNNIQGNVIANSLIELVLCNTMKSASDRDWMLLFEMKKSLKFPFHRYATVGLQCTRKPHLIKFALDANSNSGYKAVSDTDYRLRNELMSSHHEINLLHAYWDKKESYEKDEIPIKNNDLLVQNIELGNQKLIYSKKTLDYIHSKICPIKGIRHAESVDRSHSVHQTIAKETEEWLTQELASKLPDLSPEVKSNSQVDDSFIE